MHVESFVENQYEVNSHLKLMNDSDKQTLLWKQQKADQPVSKFQDEIRDIGFVC